jgi:hypothetical protein
MGASAGGMRIPGRERPLVRAHALRRTVPAKRSTAGASGRMAHRRTRRAVPRSRGTHGDACRDLVVRPFG